MTTEASSIPIFEIASEDLRAEISSLGAELIRLRDEAGRELQWDGDPAFWRGRSPLLFPIVGRVKGDHVKVDGVSYPMNQHGFARASTFELAAYEPSQCRLTLRSSAATRIHYPFDFILDVTYRLNGRRLEIDVRAQNLGGSAMPASMGFHPAFRWPLPYGAERSAHEMLFARDEPGPVSKVVGGLLSPTPKANPVEGRHLALTDELFAEDALIFLDPQSRSLRYGPAEGRALHVDFPDMPYLGIWTKPGAGFVCIEPWHGFASPEDFDGELADKHGMVLIGAGQEQSFGMSVTLDPA